ncbi:MAG: FMN-binding negative transcriptional regulator, partial [Candidatus Dormibacteraceae bacterium]
DTVMYIPRPDREERLAVLHDVIRENSFATIISNGDEGMVATHLPLLLDPDRGQFGTLIGHVARENRQWRAFSEDQDSLVLFQGPHAYISPSWYAAPLAVPTWNYVAVHAYGRPRLIEDAAALYRIVAELTRYYEAGLANAWDLEPRRDYAEKLLKNIVGFEMEISRLEGKRKLSQGRSKADRAGVIEALSSGGDYLGTAIAGLMREQLSSEIGG